jgi:hypothetical protein
VYDSAVVVGERVFLEENMIADPADLLGREPY